MGMQERWGLGLLVALLCFQQAGTARAWVFHEHAEIGRAAIALLSLREQAQLESLWGKARQGVNASLLCEQPQRRVETDPERCVDAAMLPAIAADHSCSPEDMLDVVKEAGFVIDVIAVARQAATNIRGASSEEERLDEWTAGHTLMQGADPDYLDRATVSGAHFLAPRELYKTLPAHLETILTQGTPSSAIALYALYHAAALELAEGLPGDVSVYEVNLARSVAQVLLVETFAQHFLEDAFAAGHIVGARGSDGQRMGTHDYYCSHGMEVRTWGDPGGDQYVAYGDAHLRPHDTMHAALAVRESWSQLLAAFPSPMLEKSAAGAPAVEVDPELQALVHFNACTDATIPAQGLAIAQRHFPQLLSVIGRSPQPSVKDDKAAPPRFTKEQGLFMTFFAGGGADLSFAGYANPSPYGTIAGIQTVGLGLGYDLTGYLSRAYDSGYWLQVRAVSMGQQARLDGPFEHDAVIQRRMGLEVRLRAPFAVLPGDGLLAIPFLLWAPDIGIPWGLAAARGDYWLQGRGEIGQFVLGREVAVRYLFRSKLGSSKRADNYPRGVPAWQLDLPVFDIRFFRSFEKDLALGLLMQFGVGFDINDVGTAYRIFASFGFDARLYPID